MARNVIATVSPDALHHNLKQIKRLAPSAKIMAMVKANAYGHGLKTVVRALQHVDAFGVACIDEALLIPSEGISTNTVLMEGIFREEELPLVERHGFTQVIHHWPQITALQHYLAQHQPAQPFKVWLKLNTGMNRLGFPLSECEEAYRVLLSLHGIEIIGFMTHFAQADDRQSENTANQIALFEQVTKHYPGERCLANSAAILAGPHTHSDWIRPGLMLYGASPFADSIGADFNLQPAMTLRSEIIALQSLSQGARVGYSGTWENSQSKAKIGIVAMGYGDGYPWHAKNGTPVLVKEHLTKTVGRVSMDMLAVDLSDCDDVKVGDPVVLWGEGLPIEHVAQHAGTIPYELFCRFTERVTVKVV